MSSYELTDPQVKLIKKSLCSVDPTDKRSTTLVERIYHAFDNPIRKDTKKEAKAAVEKMAQSKEPELAPHYATMLRKLGKENGMATANRLGTKFEEVLPIVNMGYVTVRYSLGIPDFTLTEKGMLWLTNHPNGSA